VRDKIDYSLAEPWVKTVLAWWNSCYNDGLLDSALFTKTADQASDEIARGRFAVFPSGGNLVANARHFAKDHGLPYGWRQLPAWWPVSLENADNDASNQWVSYTSPSGGSVITRHVTEDTLPQVANWLDYHYSEEYDILKSWGPASFSTGDGVERRFRQAYRDLERFQVYGLTGPKDGYYYGVLGDSAAQIDPGAWDWETLIGNFTLYPLAPMYVYPRVARPWMGFDGEMLNAWTAFKHQRLVSFFPQLGWSDHDLPALPSPQGAIDPAAAAAITGAPSGFETAYAAFQKPFLADDFQSGMAVYQAQWKKIWNASVRKYWK
jgi:hypothetical protein